jgi:hypothetical protein
VHKKTKKRSGLRAVCGPMRRGRRAWWCMVCGVLLGKRLPVRVSQPARYGPASAFRAGRVQARPMPGACRLRVRLLAAAVRFGFAGYTQRSNSDAAESFRTAAGFLRRRRADFWRHSATSTTPPVEIVYMRHRRAAGSHLSHGAQNLNFARSFWNPFETRPNSTSSC